MNNTRQEVIESLKEMTAKEIEKNKIMISFYQKIAENKDKEDKAKDLLKAEQIMETLKFNEAFYDFIQKEK